MPTGSRSSALSLHNFVTAMEIVELKHAGYYVRDISQYYSMIIFVPFDSMFEKIKHAIFEAKVHLPDVLYAPITESSGCNISLCSKLEFPCCLQSYPLCHKDIKLLKNRYK